MDRYFIAAVEARSVGHADVQWSWRLATSTKHLEEKIALFWHSLLAVGGIKLDHGLEMLTEIELFRRYGLGKFRDVLLQISLNPGMMYWFGQSEQPQGRAKRKLWSRAARTLFDGHRRDRRGRIRRGRRQSSCASIYGLGFASDYAAILPRAVSDGVPVRPK